VYYAVTDKGHKRLAALREEWQRVSGGIANVLGK
jgi:DNA-binding PadR family transcriptional regulator